MCKKLLYLPKDEFCDVFNVFDSCKKSLCSINPINPFFTSQIELVFNNTNEIDELLYCKLCARFDYKKIKNKHIIENKISDEIYSCVVNEYAIYLESSSNFNAFEEILYQINKNHVIIDL